MCWRILCLGIYRLDRRGFRVVITNPPKSLKIHIEDQVSGRYFYVKWCFTNQPLGWPISCHRCSASFRVNLTLHQRMHWVQYPVRLLIRAPFSKELPEPLMLACQQMSWLVKVPLCCAMFHVTMANVDRRSCSILLLY